MIKGLNTAIVALSIEQPNKKRIRRWISARLINLAGRILGMGDKKAAIQLAINQDGCRTSADPDASKGAAAPDAPAVSVDLADQNGSVTFAAQHGSKDPDAWEATADKRPDQPSLARVGYEAYRNHTGGKSLATGQDIPAFDELPEKIKDAWLAAATAVESRCYRIMTLA
jgi:hypothetical protein